MASSIDSQNQALAEAVRHHPVLYDKNCGNFKDKWEKMAAWEEVAKEAGLMNGEAARVAFYNLRTRFARMLKKKRSINMVKPESSATTDNVVEVMDDEEHFPYLSWLETHIKTRHRLTLSNGSKAICSDYGNEDSDIDEMPESLVQSPSRTQEVNNLRPAKKAKLLKSKARLNNEVSNKPAEVHVLQSIGATLGRKSNDISRHEDEIFGAFVISQLRQIPQHRKILLKMQISNMLYNEVLSNLSSSDVNITQPAEVTPSTTPLNTITTQSHNLEPNISLSGSSVATVTLPPSAQAVQATIPLGHDSQTMEVNSVLSQRKYSQARSSNFTS